MDDRIAALEERIANQDSTIEELNVALTAQWRTIDALSRQIASQGDRLQELARREPGGAEPPPPHY